MPCCNHNSSISKDAGHLTDQWFSVLSSMPTSPQDAFHVVPEPALRLSRASVAVAWLLGVGWGGLKAAVGCSKAGSREGDQRGRGSTGAHRCQQPFCHLLEGMPGWGATVGLRSWEAEAGFPEAMCRCSFMGVSGASSTLLYTSPWLSPSHMLPPPLSAVPAVPGKAPSSLHTFLFPLHLEDCIRNHSSAHIHLARLRRLLFLFLLFFLVLSFWKKLCWLIHISSICVIQAISS